MTIPPQTPQDQLLALIVQTAVVPLAFLIVGVLARRLGRRDGDDTPRRNDWAAATTVLLMSMGKVAGDLLEAASKRADTLDIVWWLLGLLFATFISVDRDRYASWVLAGTQPTRLKRIWGGIVFPDMVAVLLFSAYQYIKLKKVIP